MQDLSSSFSSVEDMLRWQIADARERAKELEQAFLEARELYPLPKSTDGLPDGWAYGGTTHQQVALSHALNGLKQIFHQIEKAESALSDGVMPGAIHWVVMVNRSIGSTATAWQSSGALRMFRYVGKLRQINSLGGKQRWKNKKRPSKLELEAHREAYYSDKGHYQGWVKEAEREFDLSDKTLNAILKELG